MSSYWDVMADAVAYWPLQETSGTGGADLAGVNPAALQAGLDFAAGSVAGPSGWLPRALRFNGSTQLANIPAQTTLGLGAAHSYALWWKPYAAPPWSPQVLVETGGSTHGSLIHLGDSDIKFVSSRNNVASHVSVSAPTWGSWRHLVAVQKSSSLEVYLDGALAGVAAVAAAWVQSGNTTGAIGAADGGRWITGYLDSGRTCYFNGAIAGVSIFDRALSAAEVAELYQGPEPTSLSAPTIASGLRVGSRVTATAGSWEGYSNGTATATGVLQFSADGLSGWEDVVEVAELDGYRVPLSAVGLWARIAATATNLGGVSEAAYSSAVQVLSARTPGAAVAQDYAQAGALAGYACPSGGVRAGLVLSGLNP